MGDDEGLAKGTSIGRYLVLGRLGAGAMGVVYAAYDPELDRKIAIKLLRPEEGKGDQARRQERLVREAKAIAKLSHPNVVGIFDVGVHDGQVFLAMEYLGGGTLREWVAAKKRPWREVVKTFIDVGHGLAAAHAEGLIHRDFKPDNVLLDKQGKPKVVDFGLVRLTGAALETSATGSVDSVVEATEEVAPESVAPTVLAALTRTGAMTGTPAYMAPEQFLGKPIDARTDQFAFCVALYEALSGQRPFAGETVLSLAGAVTAGRMKELPKEANVPGWIRKSVQRGLLTDPAQRHRGFDELLFSLARDPAVKIRRRVGIATAVVVVVASIILIQRRAERRRIDFEKQVAARLADGRSALSEAKALEDRLLDSRGRALAAFDANRREEGERVWDDARSFGVKLDAAHEQAQRALSAALDLDSSRIEVRALLGGLLYQRASLAELEYRREDLDRYLRHLEAVDAEGTLVRRWNHAGSLSVRTTPVAALGIEQYRTDRVGHRDRLVPTEVGGSVSNALENYELKPGSYRLRITRDGYAPAVVPLVIKRSEPVVVEVALPTAEQVPKDFVFVAAGRFLYGDSDEDSRLSFLNAVPIHEKRSGSYLIKAHETTFGEWIEYLSTLSPGERRSHLPESMAVQGSVRLRQRDTGEWQLDLSIAGARMSAAQGEKLVYPSRPKGAAPHDWLQMPVVGVSPRDMQSYFDWLDRTGRVRGARFCTEEEWERAARGADGRSFPTAMSRLDPQEANVDATYGRLPGSYGPDEVGRHPQSRSPFGIDDMAGNVWEVVSSDESKGAVVLRGGGYYQGSLSARTTNREPAENTTKSHFLGFRVCADAPAARTEKRP